jgi:hypothetical protein
MTGHPMDTAMDMAIHMDMVTILKIKSKTISLGGKDN